MSNIINRIRSGAGKAAFEADKLRRVNAVQSKIKSLKTGVEKTYYQVGHVAFTLYHNGRVTQPELKEACERLAAIQAQIAAQEQEIEQIRAETYVEPQTGAQYGRVCPKGHGPIPLPNNFCQVCGAAAVETQPPPPAATAYCQNCGTALTPGVRFCSHCGQTASEPAPPTAPTAPPGDCPVCGVTLLPDAVFCAECGHRLTSEDMAAATETVDREETIAPIDAYPPVESPAPEMDMPEADMETAVPEEPETDDDEAEPAAMIPETDLAEGAVLDNLFEPPAAEVDELEDDPAMLSTLSVPGVCPACAAPMLPEAAFCAECGHRITQNEE